MTDAAPRRRLGRRAPKEEGPRARFSALVPYLLEHRGVLAVVVVLSIVAAGTTLAQPLLTSQIISSVQAGEPLGPIVWVLIALLVVSALLSALQHYLLQRTGTSVVLSARRQLVRRILRLPISEFDRRRTGDLVSRVGSDTTLLYAAITQGLVDLVGSALVFVGALIAMLVLNAVLLGITLLVIALALVTVGGLGTRIRKASQQQQERVGDLAAGVERVVGAIRTVRAANATEREGAVIEAQAGRAWESGVAVAKASALVVPIAGVALQGSLLAVLGVGGYLVASGATTIADLVAFILFLFLLVMPLGTVFGAVTSVSQALGALGRIQEILELPTETAGDTRTSGVPAISSDEAIAFEGVSFSYPDDVIAEGEEDVHRGVLRDVSFGVGRGKRTALVGPSGAGKSTILALIERFYDPTDGVVRLGGVDLRGLDREELRANIGYVEQDAPVLAGTIRENLLLGAPDASEDECRRVLASVNLTDVLERNELGLDAPVGEDGVMLSGGERQRLAIARTLLAAPPILLLDESTSSLDGLNEQRLREAIDAVAENRTLLVIAHRLSTVVDSDQIVVLEKGRVVGTGTHEELLESTPLYRDLARHQLLV